MKFIFAWIRSKSISAHSICNPSGGLWRCMFYSIDVLFS